MNTEDSEQTYLEIDTLVEQHKKGSELASTELIRYFGYDPYTNETSWLIGKYFNLLRYGGIKFRNKDTRRFIRLFTSDPKLKADLIPGYQYAETKKQSRIIVQRINDRMAYLEDTEIIYDLVSILLDLASRYQRKKDRNNFCAYVGSSFHFYVFNYYSYLFKDLFYSNRIEPFSDHLDEHNEVDIKDSWDQDLYFEHERQELGFNWILGRTATFPFNHLTQFDRTLISLYDHKNMTYEEVGAQMGYHRDTIWRKRKDIKNRISNLLKTRGAYK